MKLQDAFKEIRTGVNLKSPVLQGEGEKIKCYTFKKNALDYALLQEDKFEELDLYGNIDSKYFMQPRDIIISTKKPYKVATYPYNKVIKVIIQNNFIILREINMDLYSYVFVTNYLEKIAIEENFKDKKSDLSIEDIKSIELPEIPKQKQMNISDLMTKINERGILFSKLLKNDNEIITYAINKIVGVEDV